MVEAWYSNRDSRLTEASYGVAKQAMMKKDNKKKDITCLKCKKVGHYYNKCDKEDTLKTSNKKGSSFLVLNEDIHESSLEEESLKLDVVVTRYSS